MYLKSLDLQGFKSFPDKIKLEFNQGITAVVGPNGSGKSNISDAIRWVLGEQRARHLRGDKMEDIIFVGTENRKSLNFAEVSITIDNSDGKLPIAYTEVKVTRLVSRIGDSEYRINGKSCRLKDIQELFMDTGIGKEGYSIISQGRIDQILNAKGEERRKLFEEATGIGKYKTRRYEALMNIEKERENLVRIADIISEIEEQIHPLEEQSQKAQEYLLLRDRLKEIEIYTLVSDMKKITNDKSIIEEEILIINRELKNSERQIETDKKIILDQKEKNKLFDEEIQKINEEITLNATDLEKKNGEIQLKISEKKFHENNKERFLEEIKSKNQEILKNSENKSIIESKIADLNIEKDNLKKDLNSKNQLLAKLKDELSKKENDSIKSEKEINSKINKKIELDGIINTNEVLKSKLSDEKKRAGDDLYKIETQINHLEIHILATEKLVEEKLQEIESIKKYIINLENEYEDYLVEKEEQCKSMSINEKDLVSVNSRISVLEDLDNKKDGFFESVKNILKIKDYRKKGIHGVIGKLFQSDIKYELALEIVLGNSLQSIVVDKEEDVKWCINYLKENKYGRATFLPIGAIKGKKIKSDDPILKEKNVHGLGYEFIKYDKIYEDIALSLLGRTIIIEDIETGIYLSKKYKNKYKMVTLDGDLFSVGGAVSGGSLQKKTINLLGRGDEIKTLKERSKELKEAVNFGKTSYEVIEESLKRINKTVDLKKEELNKFEIELVNLKNEKDNTFNEVTNWKNQILNFKSKSSNWETEIEVINNKIKDSKISLNDINNNMGILERDLLNKRESLKIEKVDLENLSNEITNIKIKYNSILEHIKSASNDLERYVTEKISIEEYIKNKEKEINDLRNKEISKSKEQIRLEKEKDDLALRKVDLENMLLEKVTTKEKDSKFLEELEIKFDINSKEHNKVTQDLQRFETRIENIENSEKHIKNLLWEEYELTLRRAVDMLEGKSEPNYLESPKDLKNKIRDLGNVNIGAIDQYKVTKKRYEEMTKQHDDIIESEEKLKKIIEELTVLMEDQFLEQFQIISENFSRVFKELFGGGEGHLKLGEDDDILESPIDIIAQPPGKKLQNMQLLSGGERALTAIALLFGILHMKPSPFCVLDEIEAALDDANVIRYGKYLQKFSDSTQFIVITHRKGTMEHSDVLYGVTMEEKGISKLISVNFTDHIEGVN